MKILPVVIGLLCIHVALGAIVTRTVFLSSSAEPILSGDTSSCPTANASTCKGGLVSVLTLIRYRANAFGEKHVLLHYMDRQTPFVQMHPKGWGVNVYLYDRLGVPFYTIPPSITSTERGLEALLNGSARPLLANIEVSPTNPWHPYKLDFFVDSATGIAVASFDSTSQPNSAPSVATLVALVPAMRRHPQARITVVFWQDDRVQSVSEFVRDAAAAVAADRISSASMPDVVIDASNPALRPHLQNGTWIVGCASVPVTMWTVAFTYSYEDTVPPSSGFRPTILNVTNPLAHTINPIANAMKDATYFAHQAIMKSEADLAAATDPVVGSASTAMPFVRSGNYRMCMAGECPLGDLWMDAIRWYRNDTISFTGSGGIRGPGWPAGPIRVSHIWGSLPFANTVCRGTITGITLFELLNMSVSLATFEGVNTPTGDRLLQVSGIRYRYSTRLGGNGTGARLLGIDVLNPATGQYEPVERKKLYTFAADSFFCQGFAPLTGVLTRHQYPGEAHFFTDDIFQDVLARYLTATGPRNGTTDGRLTNDTAATLQDALAFNLVHDRSGCAANTFWDPVWFTCTPCAGNRVAAAGGAATCQAPPAEQSKTGTIVIAIVIPVIAVVAIGAVAFLAAKQKDGQRDVANAPREGRVSLLFTDIENSTKLWATCPLSMSVALDTHHAVIRAAITKHKAYEVKTAGDSFMIAVKTEDQAIQLAVEIQRQLLAQEYPSAINQVYATTDEDDLLAIEDHPDVLAPRTSDVWHGLRVRIGIHSGEPSVTFDEVVKGYDYYGPSVNVAARTEGLAAGGQILMTSESCAHSSTMNDVAKTDVGSHALKGVPDEMAIVEIMPVELANRKPFTNGATATAAEGVNKFASDNAFCDDTQSVVSFDDENWTREHLVLYSTLTRALPPKDKAPLIRKLLAAWRIEIGNHEDPDSDEVAAALMNRVGKAMLRERRRMEKLDAAQGTTGSLSVANLTSMGSLCAPRPRGRLASHAPRSPWQPDMPRLESVGASPTGAALPASKHASPRGAAYQVTLNVPSETPAP